MVEPGDGRWIKGSDGKYHWVVYIDGATYIDGTCISHSSWQLFLKQLGKRIAAVQARLGRHGSPKRH